MAHDLFISYSTEDKPAADEVCAIVEKTAGVVVPGRSRRTLNPQHLAGRFQRLAPPCILPRPKLAASFESGNAFPTKGTLFTAFRSN